MNGGARQPHFSMFNCLVLTLGVPVIVTRVLGKHKHFRIRHYACLCDADACTNERMHERTHARAHIQEAKQILRSVDLDKIGSGTVCDRIEYFLLATINAAWHGAPVTLYKC